MKQGSCIGKPSYVEVIVQLIKRESITSNGKHIISADSGFNAMREVEVDVNVDIPTTEEKSVIITRNGEVEILPTNADAMTKVTANVQVPPPPLEEKQVTITKAKTTEIITPDADVYGLSRVEVSTDIPLESKQITITENGTTTIEASEGFEGIESVEVATDVNTLQGLDFDGVFDQEQANELNQYYKDGIAYAETLKNKIKNAELQTHWVDKFSRDKQLIFCPQINFSNAQNLTNAFRECSALVAFENDEFNMPNATSIATMFYYCGSLIKLSTFNIPLCTSLDNTFNYCSNLREVKFRNTNNVKIFSSTFSSCLSLLEVEIDTTAGTSFTGTFYYAYVINKIILTSIKGGSSFNNTFTYNTRLVTLHFTEWMKGNISLVQSSILSPESIHYIIQNAVNLADGATARTLTLHAAAKTNWQNSEYYAEDLAVLSTKGITIA
jgi:hypothetical protein